MKRMLLIAVLVALGAVCASQAGASSADATLEKVMLLGVLEELDLTEYQLVEVLQGYNEYRELVDGLNERRAASAADLAAAIEADESASKISGLTRELMDSDLRLLRAQQSAMGEAATVLDAKSVAKLYLIVSDMDKAKADLLGTLGAMVCPMAGTPACPMAGTPAAPAVSSEESVLDVTKTFLDKLVAKDLDGAMAAVSEDFSHHEYGNKEELKFFVEQAIFMGYLDDVKVITDDTEVKLDGDKAVVYPIDIEGAFGTATLELTGEKRDGNWMLVSMDIFGI